jgi:hypothetical protein
MIKVGVVVLSIGVVLSCTGEIRLDNNISQDIQSNENISSNLVSVVAKVLEDYRQPGSLVYSAHYYESGGLSDSFRVVMPSRGGTAVETLRQAFRNEPTVSVSKEEKGAIVRIIGGNVKTDLLDTKITTISFRNEEDPRDAVARILALPELKAYMEHHRMQFIVTSEGIGPSQRAKPLNLILTDITLSESLDRVIKNFPGFWIYKEGATPQGERRVYIGIHEFSPMRS